MGRSEPVGSVRVSAAALGVVALAGLVGCAASAESSRPLAEVDEATPSTSEPLNCPGSWSADWAASVSPSATALVPDGRVVEAVQCDYGFAPGASGRYDLVIQRDLTAEAQKRIDVAYGRLENASGSRASVPAAFPLLMVMGRLADGEEFRTLSWSGHATPPPWDRAEADLRRDIVHSNGVLTCYYAFDDASQQWRQCPPDPVDGA